MRDHVPGPLAPGRDCLYPYAPNGDAMYLHISRKATKPRGKSSRKTAAYKSKKAKRRVNRMAGKKLGRRIGRSGA